MRFSLKGGECDVNSWLFHEENIGEEEGVS